MPTESAEIVSDIWNESRNRLKGFIAKRIKTEADVEDVLQNVFFKLHQNAAKIEDPQKIYPWVFQTTRNAIIDFYREQKPAADDSEKLLSELPFEPSDKGVEEEVLQWLEPLAGKLPEKYREALLLADFQGFTQKQLSEKLEISLSGAKSRVQRAREKLKEALLDCCFLEFNRAGHIIEYRPRDKKLCRCTH